MKEPSKTKFDIFLQDGKGTPLKDLSSSRFNARKFIDKLVDTLDVIDLWDVYMEMHVLLDCPDEKERLFFNTLICLDRDRLRTALRLRLGKGTVAMRLWRSKKGLEKKAPMKNRDPA